MTSPGGRRIRRVLVAVDASPGSVAAAAAAARMAAELEAELEGLFVEDHDLLQLGRSGQARQVGFLTATAERVDAEEIERQLRAQATRAKRALSRVASQVGVTWRFRVTRGRVASEISAAAGPEDLVSVGRRGWSRGHRQHLGSTTRALLARRRSATLLTDLAAAVARPVAVLFDGTDAAGDALQLAKQLAGSGSGLLVLATDPEAAAEARRQLGGSDREPLFLELDRAVARALPRAVEKHRPGLLVLPIGGPDLEGAALADLLARLHCPVLAVS